MSTKKTVLYSLHQAKGAKIIDFAGWLMPVEYTSMLKEAAAVRKSVGLFDVSHMGEIFVRGPESEKFLQYICSNDVKSLKEGQMQYNLLLNAQAGIIDDFMLYKARDYFLLIVNAAGCEKDYAWLKSKSSGFRVEIKNQSENFFLLALQGRKSEEILRQLELREAANLGYMHFGLFSTAGFGSLLISRSGYSGEDGFEILGENKFAALLWQSLEKAGRDFDLWLCGLGARDILRLEAGYPLYGVDMNEENNPYEVSLGWAVKEGKNFIASENLTQAKAWLEKKRIGFIMQERGFARAHYPIYNAAGRLIGEVRSGAYSPNLDKFIGSGFVALDYAQENKEIFIEIRKKRLRALTKKFPFLKLGVRKGGGDGKKVFANS